MQAPAPNARVELQVALAGPAVHLVWLAVCWPLWKLLANDTDPGRPEPIELTLWFLVKANQTLLLFNLLPVFMLDGGRALRALLAMRVHPNLATLWVTTVGFVGGGLMILYGFTRASVDGVILVVIGLSCVQASWQARRMARAVLVYGSVVQAPWESDPDAWRHGEAGEDTRAARPGWLARWRAQRSAEKRARAAAQQSALDKEVDAILERLHQVGMGGLTDREKATLKRASEQRRGAG
jgi:hypothetical protein